MVRASSMGIAKPRPIEPPSPPPRVRIAVLMPDHGAGGVDQRAAGVAGVDRGVGLDRVDDGVGVTGLGVQADRALHRADDPLGDRAGQPQRRPDGDHAVADPEVRRPPQLGDDGVGQLDLDHRDVGLRVAADHTGGGADPGGEDGLERRPRVGGGQRDDVVVGDDVAVRVDDDAGAGAAAAARSDLQRHDGRDDAARDVRHRAGRALATGLDLREGRARVDEVVGAAGHGVARDAADGPDEQRDHGEQRQRGGLDAAAEHQLARREPGPRGGAGAGWSTARPGRARRARRRRRGRARDRGRPPRPSRRAIRRRSAGRSGARAAAGGRRRHRGARTPRPAPGRASRTARTARRAPTRPATRTPPPPRAGDRRRWPVAGRHPARRPPTDRPRSWRRPASRARSCRSVRARCRSVPARVAGPSAARVSSSGWCPSDAGGPELSRSPGGRAQGSVIADPP